MSSFVERRKNRQSCSEHNRNGTTEVASVPLLAESNSPLPPMASSPPSTGGGVSATWNKGQKYIQNTSSSSTTFSKILSQMHHRLQSLLLPSSSSGQQEFRIGLVIILFLSFCTLSSIVVWYLYQNGNTLHRRELFRLHRDRTTVQRYDSNHSLLLHNHGAKSSSSSFVSAPSLHHKKFVIEDPTEYIENINKNSKSIQDFGGLNLNFLSSESESNPFQRQIKTKNKDVHDYPWQEYTHPNEKDIDAYYAYDDDGIRNTDYAKHGDHCRRTSWHKLYNPSCNMLHEIMVVDEEHSNNKFLGEGSYRHVFRVKNSYEDPNMVFKMNRFRMGDNPFTYDNYEFVRMDALVMERLTASPRIVDIYGHCASSVLTEYLPHETETTIIPSYDKAPADRGIFIKPRNRHSYTPEKKLQMALEMAEALSDLHGFKDGVIVHDDVLPAQFLIHDDGYIKLNDFNRAEAMLYDDSNPDPTQHHYCRYQNGKGAADFRSPEEYRDGYLNEKIDIWSLGNMMYGLLTGLYPFYELNDNYAELQKQVIEGKTSFIHDRFRHGSLPERKLVEIIERCWVYHPDYRADIFEVVRFLRDATDFVEKSKNLHTFDTSIRQHE